MSLAARTASTETEEFSMMGIYGSELDAKTAMAGMIGLVVWGADDYQCRAPGLAGRPFMRRLAAISLRSISR